MLRAIALAGACLLLTPLAALSGTNDAQEIVVTAQKRSETVENLIPHVVLQKRPDFVIVELEVESDSRDLALRRRELIETLGGVEKKARASADVSVALLQRSDDDSSIATRVKPYTLKDAEALIGGGGRVDTSSVTIMLKTAIRSDDTLETAEGRIDSFVRTLPKPGRVTLSTGDVSPTLVNPGQYRLKLLELIAADAKAVTATLGAGYAAQLKHVESRVYWLRTGDLELEIYLPHELEIVPIRPN